MAESAKTSFSFDNNVLTLRRVTQVVEISERQAVLKTSETFTVRGSGLNVIKLDKDQGVVVLEVKTLDSISLRRGAASIKGLFR